MQQDHLRTLPKKLDLSQIQDPLVAQAQAAARKPKSPLTPPAEALVQNTSYGFDKPRSPARKPRPTLGRRTISSSSTSSSSAVDSESEDDDSYETDESHLLTHTRVYALAEKYDVPGLKSLAQRKFEMAMACYYDSPEFADAIEEVYCSTIDSDRGLRDVVLQAFRSHPQLANTGDVFGVIKETPSLAFELWKVERGIPV